MNDLTKEVYGYCIKEGLLKQGMKVIAGVSGGADSVCLLRMLCEIREELKLTVICVHIEHGIRGEESRSDMEFVRRLCESLNVPLKIYEEDVPSYASDFSMTLEEAGRHIRYEAFRKEAKSFGADVIAVAHHLNDQAETVLFNLARGSGLRGVSGISARRGAIIRPLLNVSRKQIEEYLQDIGQDYCVDSTNADTSYSRNGIRNIVLPELDRIVSKAAEHIVRAAQDIREADDYIRQQADLARAGSVEKLQDIVTTEKEADPDLADVDGIGRCNKDSDPLYKINIEKLSANPKIIQRYVIRSVLADIYTTHKDLEALHVDEVTGLMSLQSGRRIMLKKGITAWREGSYIMIGRREEGLDRGIEPGGIEFNLNGDTDILKRGMFNAYVEDYDGLEPVPNGLYTKWFDYDKINNGLLIRSRREGDYLTVTKDGKHKKLKKYLIDEKVPASERDSLLLLADGEHIVWIVGMRISAYYKVTSKTHRVLKITYSEYNK